MSSHVILPVILRPRSPTRGLDARERVETKSRMDERDAPLGTYLEVPGR